MIEDFIVTADAEMTLSELCDRLSNFGQTIPHGVVHVDQSAGETLSEMLDLNPPHALGEVCGNWSDWLLGAQIQLANGDLVKSGSRVSKSVAGFDLHKLMIGARGSLGIFKVVTLRTWPLIRVQQLAKNPMPTLQISVEKPVLRGSHARYFKRLKAEFDPDGKLAPDAFILEEDHR